MTLVERLIAQASNSLRADPGRTHPDSLVLRALTFPKMMKKWMIPECTAA